MDDQPTQMSPGQEIWMRTYVAVIAMMWHPNSNIGEKEGRTIALVEANAAFEAFQGVNP